MIFRRQIPVILENCTADWEAQRSWSFKYSLGLGGGAETWRTDYIDNLDIIQLWGQQEHITGQQVENIMRNNGTVRVFEMLGRKRAKEARRTGDRTFRLKERLMSDYSKPGPIPSGENNCRLC